MIRMTGPDDNLRPAAHFLYADWLPRSGEELRDFPMFAERVKFFPDVPSSEAVTDVFLPLA
ncbi:GyrI-like domain-containing protein [Sphingomonas kyeonggiensis]|nr:GyrI-like domain-containing protein [Sphingomonas kyeonggiensis]